MTEWADGLTTIALRWNTGEMSIRDLFVGSAPPDALAPDEFRSLVSQRLDRQPELVEAWQNYSHDKRGTPSPYLDGLEVGFLDSEGRGHDVAIHPTPLEACADFLYRETEWVLHRRRVDHG